MLTQLLDCNTYHDKMKTLIRSVHTDFFNRLNRPLMSLKLLKSFFSASKVSWTLVRQNVYNKV